MFDPILLDIKRTIEAVGAMMKVINNRHTAHERAMIIRTCTCTSTAPSDRRYLTVTYKRQDNTTAMVSTLSGLDAVTKLHATRTEEYYNATGAAINRTVTYTLTYDSHRFPVGEQITTVTNF